MEFASNTLIEWVEKDSIKSVGELFFLFFYGKKFCSLE